MKAIQVKYLGPTNKKGSRVKAFAEGVKTVTLAYDYSNDYFNLAHKAAIILCQKNDWPTTLIGGQLPNNDYVFVFTNKKGI